jgi:uncharacterized protein
MRNNFYPTQAQNRIELLDVLRGFAIAGVLLSNILILSGSVFTPFSDLEHMHMPGLNRALRIIASSIIQGKFYPILMILFGAGLFMQFRKSDKHGFVKFFSWRMFILVLIGLVHQTFWAGDVVTVYALFAFLLIPMRNLQAKSYLIVALVMFVLHFIVGYIQTITSAPAESIEHIAQFELPGVTPHDLINTVRNDGFAGLWFITSKQLGYLWTIPRYLRVSPSIIFLFMLGAYFLGSGFLTEKAYKLKYLLSFLVLGLAGSFLMFYVSWSYAIIGNVFLALTYISLIAVLMGTHRGSKFLSVLAPMGRMALTNYIMQSVICILIFYGVGFAFFAQLPLYLILLIGIVILIFQIVFSKYWLNKHSFGPLEGLWRRLSYGKDFNKQ